MGFTKNKGDIEMKFKTGDKVITECGKRYTFVQYEFLDECNGNIVKVADSCGCSVLREVEIELECKPLEAASKSAKYHPCIGDIVETRCENTRSYYDTNCNIIFPKGTRGLVVSMERTHDGVLVMKVLLESGKQLTFDIQAFDYVCRVSSSHLSFGCNVESNDVNALRHQMYDAPVMPVMPVMRSSVKDPLKIGDNIICTSDFVYIHNYSSRTVTCGHVFRVTDINKNGIQVSDEWKGRCWFTNNDLNFFELYEPAPVAFPSVKHPFKVGDKVICNEDFRINFNHSIHTISRGGIFRVLSAVTSGIYLKMDGRYGLQNSWFMGDDLRFFNIYEPVVSFI